MLLPVTLVDKNGVAVTLNVKMTKKEYKRELERFGSHDKLMLGLVEGIVRRAEVNRSVHIPVQFH